MNTNITFIRETKEDKKIRSQAGCMHGISTVTCSYCGKPNDADNGCPHIRYVIRCALCNAVLGSEHTDGAITHEFVL